MSSGTYGRALRGAPRRALLVQARRRIFETQKAAAAESAYRQYRVARWFLLPETELRPRLAADCKNSAPKEVSSQYGISAEETSRPQDGN